MWVRKPGGKGGVVLDETERWCLDGHIGYGGRKEIRPNQTVELGFDDSPYLVIKDGNNELGIYNLFRVHAMYRPDKLRAVWISIGAIQWKWAGEARLAVGPDGQGDWVVTEDDPGKGTLSLLPRSSSQPGQSGYRGASSTGLRLDDVKNIIMQDLSQKPYINFWYGQNIEVWKQGDQDYDKLKSIDTHDVNGDIKFYLNYQGKIYRTPKELDGEDYEDEVSQILFECDLEGHIDGNEVNFELFEDCHLKVLLEIEIM